MNTCELIAAITRRGWTIVFEDGVGDNEGFVELIVKRFGREFKSIQPREIAAMGGLESSLRQFATNGMAENL